MPAVLTYPGIYIEEIPSGVRTIVGVATSITAFIGRTQRGPVDKPTTIHSFADFERTFGGLWYESTVSYAVRDFYLNGGQEAIIVRLFNPLFENEKDREAKEEAARKEASEAADDVITAAHGAAAITGASGEGVALMAEKATATSTEIARVVYESVAKAAKQAVTPPASVAEAAEGAAKEAGKSSIAAFIAADKVAKVARDAVGADEATSDSVAMAAEKERDSINKKADDDFNKVDGNTSATNAEKLEARRKMNEIKTAINAVAEKARGAVTTANDVALAAANAKDEVVSAAAASAAPRPFAQIYLGDLILQAANPGAWGNSLRARVDYNGIETRPELFNLTIRDMNTGTTERFLNVTTQIQPDSSRRLDKVLENESNLVRVLDKLLPVLRPDESDKQLNEEAALGKDPNASETDKNKAIEAKKGLKVPPFSNPKEKRSSGVEIEGLASDGNYLRPEDFIEAGDKKGLNALEKADLFNLLCIPPLDRDDKNDPQGISRVYQKALTYCCERRAMLLVDPPKEWGINKDTAASKAKDGLDALGLSGTDSRNSMLYFPRVLQIDPLREGQISSFVPCGIIAGTIARTDSQRGIWKAPAGIDASLNGIVGLEVNLTDAENGTLNPLGINCLRSFRTYGNVIWGARTMRGADQISDEYKYISVRRVALFIEESLYRALKWVVFEPNDEPLWSQIRLNVGAFMHSLFRQGAFQGKTPQEAYFVKCDKNTTTQDDINKGIVNIMVGFAPLKPAEFVVIKLQQMAGQIQT